MIHEIVNFQYLILGLRQLEDTGPDLAWVVQLYTDHDHTHIIVGGLDDVDEGVYRFRRKHDSGLGDLLKRKQFGSRKEALDAARTELNRLGYVLSEGLGLNQERRNLFSIIQRRFQAGDAVEVMREVKDG